MDKTYDEFIGVTRFGMAREIICLRTRVAELEAALEQAPAPAMPQPDWSTAPEWAEWWAVNADLEAFWYAFKPYPLTNLKDACWQWSDGDEFKRIGFAGEAALPLGVDWRTTLTQRPASARGQKDSSRG